MSGWPGQSTDYEPYAYFKGVSVDVTIILIVSHIVTMLACFLLGIAGLPVATFLEYTHTSIPSLQLWELFLYPWYHNIVQESIWFAVGLYFFYLFGRQVEQFIGHKKFMLLYGLLVVVPALAITPLAYLLQIPFGISAASYAHFGVFVAFATIYPNIQMMFGFQPKWIVAVVLIIFSLVTLGTGDWIGFALLWASPATAFLTLKSIGAGPSFSWIQEWRTEQAEKKMNRKRKRLEQAESEFNLSVDHILEKISKQGIHSLTPAEKRHLEKARAKLLEQDKHP